MDESEYERLGNCDDTWLCPKCCMPSFSFSSSLFELSSSAPVTSAPGISCKFLNARSIVNKREDLQALLESEQLDVLAVAETFLDDDILDSELVDNSYVVFRRDRNRHGGGVMLLLRNNLPAVRRYDLESDCEVLWIQVSIERAPLFLGVYYRPPCESVE